MSAMRFPSPGEFLFISLTMVGAITVVAVVVSLVWKAVQWMLAPEWITYGAPMLAVGIWLGAAGAGLWIARHDETDEVER